MSTTKHPNRRAELYLKNVREELVDVPWRERNELVASVRERLDELPANAVPEHELGPARAYARELRDSAGLPPQRRNPFARFRATRLRVKLISIASIVLIAVLIAALIARAHYQPISADVTSGSSNAQRITDNLVTDTDFYRYEPGKVIVSGIAIKNGGWATVTVDGVSIVSSPEGPLALRELRATDDDLLLGTYERAPIVKHVTVEAGKTMYLFVVMKMIPFSMGRPGDGETIDQPELLIRVLGVHHAVKVQGNKIGLLVR